MFQNAASAEAWGTAAEGPPHLATALAQGESVVEQFSEGSGLELLDDYRYAIQGRSCCRFRHSYFQTLSSSAVQTIGASE